jgi:TetR/AcrR family transcriptional repressor of mexJK operon
MARQSPTPPRPVGRPRDPEKRAAIIDAGWSAFLAEGVRGASLEAIARSAKVSRVTLYSHFADKEALFEAAIRREMDRIERTQQPFPPDMSLRDGLIAFGQGLMGYLTSPDAVSFYSVLAGELRRHATLAKAFFDLGPGVTLRNLSKIIATADAKGELRVSDPAEAAEHLIGLWQGLSNFKLALGIEVEVMKASTPRRVERAVDTFLAVYAPTNPKPASRRLEAKARGP